MKKLFLLLAALATIAPSILRADSAVYPLRDARQLTAVQTATVTNSFADGACTIDRIEVKSTSPASGTFTLRHIWQESGLTATNSWTVTYTNTAVAALTITNAWHAMPGDYIVGDFGQSATGKFWLGRSKLNYVPAR